MIAIINKGPTSHDEVNDPGGERKYQIKINHTLIAEFTHYRRDGLAVCLGKAAEAVRYTEQDKIERDAEMFLFAKLRIKKVKFEPLENE